MSKKINIKNILLVASMFTIASCGAIYTRMSKDDMTVKVEMSSTIWLEPVAPANQTVYVQMRNTSGNALFSDLNKFIEGEFVKKGYKIETNPDNAYYIMQVNVRSAVLNSKQVEGSGSALSGAAAGGAAGSALGKGSGQLIGIVGGAVIGGIAAMAVDANTKDGFYDVVVDIRLGEQSKSTISTSELKFEKQGDTRSISSSSGESNRKYYTTVLRATSNMVNLTEEEGS
ncbi:MAG: complement resistance protein TraT [Rickettsiales bacterium]|jgi:outer membrane lipoprotein SlyB|nr:complement resistance protein TraT [Rickettsiales bacterium]